MPKGKAPPGKFDAQAMKRVVFRSLGAKSPKVVVGPGIGFDNGIVSIGRKKVMILTTDPVSFVPSLGAEMSAWLSVNLIASDFTASGTDPDFAVFSYNFPETLHAGQKEDFIRAIGRECKNLGVSVVGGHTGSYPGAALTVIGAGMMIGLSERGRYLTPETANPGDVVLMTKHAGIEAAAYLANSFSDYVEKKVGSAAARNARSMISLCSTVQDARTARRAGIGPSGVTSMHDATEGGVMGALLEMAEAAGVAFDIDVERIPVRPEVRKVCTAFNIDPLTSLSEGALLLTCAPSAMESLSEAMRKGHIELSEIGAIRKGRGVWATSRNGGRVQTRPAVDQYWKAYAQAEASGLT